MFSVPITKYEKARIIGVRATHIANGSKICTDIGNLTDPLQIAMKEFDEGTIPISIKRTLPNGKQYIVHIRKKTIPSEKLEGLTASDSTKGFEEFKEDTKSDSVEDVRKKLKKMKLSETEENVKHNRKRK